ncbi:hypothetical protein DFH08DRAFT_701247, partial [Mycena albidolilacea]
GQTGLNIAARFKQMDISAVVIEMEARVRDVWCKHYPTLTLHMIRTQHTGRFEIVLVRILTR